MADRWDRDDRQNFLFQRQMMSEGWAREDAVKVDEVANSKGESPSRKGEGTGRSRAQPSQHEGFYDRVSMKGAQPDMERELQNIPHYVHQRNAARRAEAAMAHGQEVSGLGSEGYGTKGKGKRKGGSAKADTGDDDEPQGRKGSRKGEGKGPVKWSRASSSSSSAAGNATW